MFVHTYKSMKLSSRFISILLCLFVAGMVSGCRSSKPKTKGVGDTLRAFIIQDCMSGQKYCQVCAYSGKPTIMAIGDVNDDNFIDDLDAIQKVVSSSASKGLTAFALVGSFKGEEFGKLGGDKKSVEKLKNVVDARKLSFPVVVLPDEMSDAQKQNYASYASAYDIKQSRTVLYAGADNKIKFAEVITNTSSSAQFKKLNQMLSQK